MTIATMLSLGETALKLGLICSLTVLALFLSYSMSATFLQMGALLLAPLWEQ